MSYAQQGSNSGVSSYFRLLGVVLSVAALIYASSFAIAKYNDDQKVRLTQNNLQLVKDNRELRKRNEQLTQQLTDYRQRLNKIDEAMEGYKQ